MEKISSCPIVKLQDSTEAKKTFAQTIQYHAKALFGLNDSFTGQQISELWIFISKEFPTARVKQINEALYGYASGKYLPKSDYRTINGVFLGRLMKDYFENVQTPKKEIKTQHAQEKQPSEQEKKQIEYEFLNECLIKRNFTVQKYCAHDVWKALRNCGIEIKVTLEEQEKAKFILKQFQESKKLLGEKYEVTQKDLWNIGCMIAINRFFKENDIIEIGEKIDSYYE